MSESDHSNTVCVDPKRGKQALELANDPSMDEGAWRVRGYEAALATHAATGRCTRDDALAFVNSASAMSLADAFAFVAYTQLGKWDIETYITNYVMDRVPSRADRLRYINAVVNKLLPCAVARMGGTEAEIAEAAQAFLKAYSVESACNEA